MSGAISPSELVIAKTMAQTSTAEESWEKGAFDRKPLDTNNPGPH